MLCFLKQLYVAFFVLISKSLQTGSLLLFLFHLLAFLLVYVMSHNILLKFLRLFGFVQVPFFEVSRMSQHSIDEFHMFRILVLHVIAITPTTINGIQWFIVPVQRSMIFGDLCLPSSGFLCPIVCI